MCKSIMNHFRKIINIFKNAWITVWLIVVAILCVTSTYAAYTGVTQSKRVISLSDRDDMLFSSRYMFIAGSDVQKIGFSESTTDPTITIDVCNYDKNGMGKYGSDIYFQLSARLINFDGTATSGVESNKFRIAFLNNGTEDSSYQLISLSSDEAKVIPGPETYNGISNVYKLTGGMKSKYKFVLHCDPDGLSSPQYAVELTAQPIGDYNDIIKKISGKVAAVSRNSQSLEWSGEFTDKMISSDASVFDAYNYVISGVGKGMITLTYNSNLLELDKNDMEVFTELQDADPEKYNTTTDGDFTTIKFPVDTTAENAVSRYAIHFYQKTGSPLPDYSENYVKTDFTAS